MRRAEIDLELSTQVKNTKSQANPQKKIRREFRWLSGLSYRGHELSWLECVESNDNDKNRFVFLTDIEVNLDNVIELAVSGRMRFKIENEGFNRLKNGGYGLGDKFSRVSTNAMKNYVSLMHIAQLFNQLYELSSLMQPLLTGKKTLKNLWKSLLGSLTHIAMNPEQVLFIFWKRRQFRYG